MEKNREISQPDDKAEKPSTSKRAETKSKDFATGWNISEHNMQSEVPRDLSPSDTNLHLKRQTSNEKQRDKIAHPESGLRSASGDETGGQGQLGQNMSDWKAWYQNKATSNKVLDELIAKRLGQKEDLYHKMCDLNNKTLDYEEKYHELEKDRGTIEKEIDRLKEEYNDFSKKYEFLKTEINGLNSKIAVKEQKHEEILFHFDKLIKEQNKNQGEYNRLTKEIGIQVDSQSNNLEDLEKKIQRKLNVKRYLHKQIKNDEENILMEQPKQPNFDEKISKIESLDEYSQKMRDTEREIYKLEKKIQSKKNLIEIIGNQNQAIHNDIREMTKEIKNINSSIDKLSNNKLRFEFYTKDNEENIDLSSEIRYYKNMVKHLANRINRQELQRSVAEKNIRNLADKIKMIDSFLEDPKKKKIGYEQSLSEQKKKLKEIIANNPNVNNSSTFDSFKNDELAAFKEQLAVIREYSKNNSNIENITNELSELNKQYKNLQVNKNKIEKLEDDNRKKKQEKAIDRFYHNLYLKQRDIMIISYQLEPITFETFKNQDLYDKQDLKSMQKMLDKISKKIEEFENRYQSKKNDMDNLMKKNQQINRKIAELDGYEDIDDEKKNRQLHDYIETWRANLSECNKLGKEALQLRDEKEQHNLQLLSIKDKIYDHRSKEIESYRSELASFHTKKSELQTKIDAELTQIASQFETNLHDLQQTCDKQTLRLEKVSSELKALEKNMQQETKRQELQGQLDRLASQVNTARHESETITQELEDYRQKLENSRKELDAADQKKLLLGTKIEHAKKKLEEIEKEMKIAENKWRGKYDEYIKAINELMHLKNIGEMTKVILEKAKKYQEVKNKYEHAKGEYEHTKNKYEYAEYNHKHVEYKSNHARNKYKNAEYQYKNADYQYKQAGNKYENAEYQYKNAEHKLTNELQVFKNMVQRPNSLPHGRDLSTEGLPPNQRPQQALKKVGQACIEWSHAWTELPHAWTELSHAWTELSHAWTELSHASTELSHARTELSHARTELSHASTELSHASTELSHARTELSHARIDTSDAVITRAPLDDEERTRMREAKEEAMQSREWRQPQPKRPWDEAAEVK